MSTPSVTESLRSKLASTAEELVASASESTFDAATFFQKFEQLADLPGAIGQLRHIVLQAAIRGQLTDQQSVETVESQVASLFTKHATTGSESFPFSIPANWSATPIGNVMKLFNGKAFKKQHWDTIGLPIIRIQNLNNVNATFNYCNTEVEQRYHVHSGDLLISWSGTPGTSFGAFIWERGDAYLNQHIFRCEVAEGTFEIPFLRLAVNARLDEMISHAQGAVGLRHITKGKLESIYLPLPPLAEQKRIVGKVDELMGLCDRLEALESKRKDRHASLSRAALARFADAPTPTNLQFLFHNSFDVEPEQLRQAILNLATCGGLTQQDLENESSVGLASLAAHVRAEQIAAGTLKKVKPLETESNNGGFENLPANWTVSRVDELAIKVTDGEHATPKREETGHYLLSARNVRDGFIDVSNVDYVGKIEFDRIRKRCDPNEGDILLSCSGSVGRVAIVDEDDKYAMVRSAALIKPCRTAIDSEYFSMALRSPRLQDQIELGSKKSAQANLFIEPIRKLVIPLPPIPEQKRIVTKVNELMALVDHLQQQLAHSRTLGQQLLEAVVANLTSATNQSEVIA